MAGRDGELIFRETDPLWYKDAIIYELHVRAFADSNGDGIGDFRGLTAKLDYLRDLGVTALWLLPFYPSPLMDDGYDIADYTAVHPSYGTLADFKVFLREAHRRDLRVITELVVNHTSDQHAWFQRARAAKPGSAWRGFYVWSDTPERYKDARIIFKDFETSNWTWDPVAGAYYWHRFYSHQPDLNYDNPRVHRAIFRAMDFWLDMGVDGLRLDAVPYLYEREGTNCENLPETHAFLKELRRHIDQKYSARMLLAEANQWPEDAVAYFGDGDECHMAFHFPVMPRLFMALRMEDRFPIIDILQQTPPIPENAQWAMFLRNHDELTLEMVTDEERDYMYKVYAHDQRMRINLGIRRRLAPLLGNNRRRIELMNALLFSLPGTPVIYYGDEIGMGDNIYLGDRNGVRTPMQWSNDRNAGFSTANRQRLYLPVIVDPEYHYEAVNVEAQQNNPQSLLWWMKRLIALRQRYQAFGRGTIEFLHPDNPKVLAFVRRYQDETILVVANLSRFVQCANFDLSAFRGLMPVEMYGRIEFPPIGEHPYFLTLSPHGFYWFSLEPQPTTGGRLSVPTDEHAVPILTVAGPWESLLRGRAQAMLEGVLPAYFQARRWFGGKARRLKKVTVCDSVPVPHGGATSYIALVRVDYTDGGEETYVLPLAFAEGERAGQLLREHTSVVVGRLRLGDGREGVLYDALADRGFCTALLEAIAGRRRLRGMDGDILAAPTLAFRRIANGREMPLEPSVLRGEQSNTSVIYGDRLILKLYRHPEPGTNPDLEIGRYLTEIGFAHSPPVAGLLAYRRGDSEPTFVAMLQGFVPNEGDAWTYTLDDLSRFFERALASQVEVRSQPPSAAVLLDLAAQEPPAIAQEFLADYMEAPRLLGQRTAELHLALAAATTSPDLTPEPFSTLYQRSVYQSMRKLATQSFNLLRRQTVDLPEPVRALAESVAGREGDVHRRLRSLIERKITALRTRTHGDYHLGQVLYTGKDFMIIDFEGEPARPLSERRLKRSPIRDVAGMLRSFHYATHAALTAQRAGGAIRETDLARLEPWVQFWRLWVSAIFLRAYLDTAGAAPFVPRDREALQVLLDAHLLEKAVYELGYELNNRPDWVGIPLQGIQELLGTPEATG